MTIEIIPDPEYGGFTACVPDIPAYGEGSTEEGSDSGSWRSAARLRRGVRRQNVASQDQAVAARLRRKTTTKQTNAIK